MRRRVRVVLLISLTTLAALLQAAHARAHSPAPGITPPPELQARYQRWSGDDTALGMTFGLLGSVAGFFSGAGIGAAVDPGCEDIGCDTAMIGGLTGGVVVGSAMGVWLWGEAADLDGSLWAATLGATVGAGAAWGLSYLAFGIEDPSGERIAVGLALPAVGALVGYALSHSAAEPAPARASAALLDLGPEGDLALQLPPLSVARGAEGALALHVPVLGGSF